MATSQETLNRHSEDIADLKAEFRGFRNNQKKTERTLAGVEKMVQSNQKLLHAFFIAGGIILAIVTALSPILKTIFLQAIK